MKRMLLSTLAALAVLASAAPGQSFPELSKHVPFLKERLASSRWQVRYGLLYVLDDSDDSRRLLELLIKDEHPSVSEQAQGGYLDGYLKVDKAACRPDPFLHRRGSLVGLSQAEGFQLLLDYVLGRKDDKRFHGADGKAILLRLDVGLRDNPRVVDAITVVGVLGSPADAKALYPFLDSTNEYVVVNTARALIRLGDRDKAAAGLLPILKKDPRKVVFYIKEALRLLKEIQYPQYKQCVREVLAANADMRADWWRVNDYPLLAGELDPAALSKRVPSLRERLPRWRRGVLFGMPLVVEDAESRRVLESLIKDPNRPVAQEAQEAYLEGFLRVDKTIIRPEFLGGDWVAELPRAQAGQSMVDYIVGRKDEKRFHPIFDEVTPIERFDANYVPDSHKVRSIDIVGIFGAPADAKALYPFLESKDDEAVLSAARALVRLGDNDKAAAALLRILKQDPKEHLRRITTALYLLKRMPYPQYKQCVQEVLAAVANKDIHPGCLNEFLLLAVEVEPAALK